jgi:hypothetical protein
MKVMGRFVPGMKRAGADVGLLHPNTLVKQSHQPDKPGEFSPDDLRGHSVRGSLAPPQCGRHCLNAFNCHWFSRGLDRVRYFVESAILNSGGHVIV